MQRTASSNMSPGRGRQGNRAGGDAEPAAPLVPYHGILGRAPNGCVAFSNGNEDLFSQEASLAPDLRVMHSYDFRRAAAKAGFTSAEAWHSQLLQLGVKWQCVEYVRRYLLMSKAVWIRSIPVAEAVWKLTHFLSVATGDHVPLTKHVNGRSSKSPSVGDLIVWQRSRGMPFGHIAVVVDVLVQPKANRPATPPPPVDTHHDDEESIAPATAELSSFEGYVDVAEQNHDFVSWSDKPYARRLQLRFNSQGIELMDDDAIVGWIEIHAADVNFVDHDIADNFRIPTTAGWVQRIPVSRDTSLAWLQPHDSPCDFFLKRSLVVSGNVGDGAVAAEKDTPDGYYVMDGDMWMHIRKGAHSLHDVALAATYKVVNDPRSTFILEHHFGVPVELHGLVRKSLRFLPAMFGRFDLGYDGERVRMMEYNCDSSAALYECCDTQDKWATYRGGEHQVGQSTGSFMRSKIVEYFSALRDNAALCPPNKLIHFMVDDDDEERYTALAVAHGAQQCGFRFKMCIRLIDFKFVERNIAEEESTRGAFVDLSTIDDDVAPGSSTINPSKDTRLYLRTHDIVDLDGEKVYLVWKTWSWDTVLHQYTAQRSEAQRNEHQHQTSGEDDAAWSENTKSKPTTSRPTLSDILLNERIHTLEPFWKMVCGSKALLPYMHSTAPDHPYLVYASFCRTNRMLQHAYLSKPVNGRAGQNITMYDAVTSEEERHRIAAEDAHRQAEFEKQLCSDVQVSPERNNEAASSSAQGTPTSAKVPDKASFSIDVDETKEVSTGKFFDSLVVYQRRIALKKFSDQYYPIFCGWIVGDQFGGVVVREDTSKITKLGSIVAPCRVVR